MDFIFGLDERAPSATLVGTMTRAQVVQVPLGGYAFGVRFRPGAAMLFVDGAAHEFVDGDAELCDVSVAGRRLWHAVQSAPHDAARVASVVNWLQQSSARVRAPDRRVARAVHAILDAKGALPVAGVVRESGVSERQLERLFAEHVGVRPKLFARVARLQHAAELSESRTALRASELALRAGYADEAHFAREVRELSGVTPRQLVQERHVGFVQDGRLGAG